jgi:hypothetical protein
MVPDTLQPTAKSMHPLDDKGRYGLLKKEAVVVWKGSGTFLARMERRLFRAVRPKRYQTPLVRLL